MNSSLGILFNASNVADQVDDFIEHFKGGQNPVSLPVAAVQADFVAHSMGGDVARGLLVASFEATSYGAGLVHKLVTIGTPHLGTPLAVDQLTQGSGQDPNSCVRNFLAENGDLSFISVTFGDGSVASGGLGDLEGDGLGGSLTPALQALAQAGREAAPAALIAGVAGANNLSGLDSLLSGASYLRLIKCLDDPLAQSMTSSGWPTEFSGAPSDTIVPESSQFDQLGAAVIEEQGVIHSSGLTQLGFVGPDELDPGGGIVGQVLNLLDTPVTDASFHLLPP
jgi:pimeloyl-ACP methyl ester carboxylesterase